MRFYASPLLAAALFGSVYAAAPIQPAKAAGLVPELVPHRAVYAMQLLRVVLLPMNLKISVMPGRLKAKYICGCVMVTGRKLKMSAR